MTNADDIYTEYRHRCNDNSDIHQHLPTLYERTKRYENPVILELGVRSGNSTSAFLAAMMEVGGELWSVDVQPPQHPPNWREVSDWHIIIGDDTSPVVTHGTPQELDVLFIDTSHAYDHTLEELRTYVPRVNYGGVVLMHDTELRWPEGIGPMFDPVGDAFPVARALDTYCEETGLTWHNMTGCWGLGVIEIPWQSWSAFSAAHPEEEG